MKRSSPDAPPRAPDRALARNAALLNQLGTPGLGSIMAGRKWAGVGQLTVAVIGFLFFVGWFCQFAFRMYRLISDLPAEVDRYPWLGKLGAGLFLGAWVWSWFTTCSILRQARVGAISPPNVPSGEV
jgi:hypothetical protein